MKNNVEKKKKNGRVRKYDQQWKKKKKLNEPHLVCIG